MPIRKFSIQYDDVIIRGDAYELESSLAANDPRVMCLHGGGLHGKINFLALQKNLLLEGVCSYSFDYKGHGETQGLLATTSLEDKVKQTVSVLDSQNIQEPLTLLASSMGGYIAIKMTELYKVKNLILIAPAAYSLEAFSIPFGKEFSEIIRTPLSWQHSDAWEVLKKYTGNLVIFKAEHDQVIPEGLIEKLYESAICAVTRKIITIDKANHSLLHWLNQHTVDMHVVTQEIIDLLIDKKAKNN